VAADVAAVAHGATHVVVAVVAPLARVIQEQVVTQFVEVSVRLLGWGVGVDGVGGGLAVCAWCVYFVWRGGSKRDESKTYLCFGGAALMPTVEIDARA
jgi:hypothetical protein